MTVKLVKSASRIFEILELFNQERRPMQAVEIAGELNYPLASTHELLKTLVELGYFTYGMPKWAYSPSYKISSVVDWTKDIVGDEERIQRFMEELNEATLETINLSRQVDFSVKIINGLESRHAVGVSAKPGTLMPVTQSLTGIVSLAVYQADGLSAYLERMQNTDPSQHEHADTALIQDISAAIHSDGYATRCDVMVEGVGAVCALIKSPHYGDPLVIGIVGPSPRITANADQHVRTLLALLKKNRIETYYQAR